MKNGNRVLIGKVYANWCGHCKTLKPEWKKMKKALKKINSNVEIVEIEEAEKDKLENYKKRINGLNVNGYPTIFKYSGGAVEYYNGERTAHGIQNWALENQKNAYEIDGGKKRRKSTKKTQKNRSRKNKIDKNKTFRFWF